MQVDESIVPESTSSPSFQRWSKHRKEIAGAVFTLIGVTIVLVSDDDGLTMAMTWFFGLPVIYALLRYVWLRLCRDPFLSPSDSLPSISWECVRTCPPDLQRTVPTLLFWMFLILIGLGTAFAATAAYDMYKPSLFLIITYNGFGSLLVLVCAVWAVDGLYLGYLFLVADGIMGRKGAAQTWWYKHSHESEEDFGIDCDSSKGVTSSTRDDTTSSRGNHQGDWKESPSLRTERYHAKWRLAIIVVLYGTWTYLSYEVAHNPRQLELNVPVPRLPLECDGYRLAMASDVHIGSMVAAKEAQWAVDHINALNPDAVALVGDIGDQCVNDAIREKLKPLGNLRARDGVYLSFGNHENIQDIHGFRKVFREESPLSDTITVLENEHTILTKGGTDGCSIALIGMADWSGHGALYHYEGQVAPDFPLALRSVPGPNGTTVEIEKPIGNSLPMVMMQHQPVNMEQAARDGVGLQLSGHTHGGQIFVS